MAHRSELRMDGVGRRALSGHVLRKTQTPEALKRGDWVEYKGGVGIVLHTYHDHVVVYNPWLYRRITLWYGHDRFFRVKVKGVEQ